MFVQIHVAFSNKSVCVCCISNQKQIHSLVQSLERRRRRRRRDCCDRPPERLRRRQRRNQHTRQKAPLAVAAAAAAPLSVFVWRLKRARQRVRDVRPDVRGKGAAFCARLMGALNSLAPARTCGRRPPPSSTLPASRFAAVKSRPH